MARVAARELAKTFIIVATVGCVGSGRGPDARVSNTSSSKSTLNLSVKRMVNQGMYTPAFGASKSSSGSACGADMGAEEDAEADVDAEAELVEAEVGSGGEESTVSDMLRMWGVKQLGLRQTAGV